MFNYIAFRCKKKIVLVLQKKIYLLIDMLVTCSKLDSHVHCDLLSTTWVTFVFFRIEYNVCYNGGGNVFLIDRLEKPRFQALDSLSSVQAQMSVSRRMTMSL